MLTGDYNLVGCPFEGEGGCYLEDYNLEKYNVFQTKNT